MSAAILTLSMSIAAVALAASPSRWGPGPATPIAAQASATSRSAQAWNQAPTASGTATARVDATPATAVDASAPIGDCPDWARDADFPSDEADPDLVMRCLTGMVIGYSKERRVPLWVMERLRPEDLGGPVSRAACVFAADPALAADGHTPADLDDYRATSSLSRRFDRGHMAPAADMTWSLAAMRDSCLLSNIAPQEGIGMNRHIWADLERIVRDWACDAGPLEVYTGPIFDESPDQLGKNGVHVPAAFFKIVRRPAAHRAITFILENRAYPRNGRRAADVLAPQIRSVEDVEAETGLRFFPSLDEREHTSLATSRSPMWRVAQGCRRQPARQGDGHP